MFKFLTDLSNFESMFEHIRLDAIDPVTHQLKQIRSVHGWQWHETLEVTAIKPSTNYSLKMLIFGVDVFYDYTLEPVANDVTRIQLTKTPGGKGFRKLLHPLIKHILNQPEHDGNHLQRLKQALLLNENG